MKSRSSLLVWMGWLPSLAIVICCRAVCVVAKDRVELNGAFKGALEASRTVSD